MQKTPKYPQNPIEWQSAINQGLNLSDTEGIMLYESKTFPYDQLEQWIRSTYTEGFSQDFIPALLRNIKGLVAWAYGGEEEPSWPGSDD